jgi:hypothetical protein
MADCPKVMDKSAPANATTLVEDQMVIRRTQQDGLHVICHTANERGLAECLEWRPDTAVAVSRDERCRNTDRSQESSPQHEFLSQCDQLFRPEDNAHIRADVDILRDVP